MRRIQLKVRRPIRPIRPAGGDLDTRTPAGRPLPY
jgi:hypothetical protein